MFHECIKYMQIYIEPTKYISGLFIRLSVNGRLLASKFRESKKLYVYF